MTENEIRIENPVIIPNIDATKLVGYCCRDGHDQKERDRRG